MLYTTFAILAAFLTIFIAGLLVKKQNKCHETRIKVEENNTLRLLTLSDEVTSLTNEASSENTLLYLEKRVELFNDSIRLIQKPNNRNFYKRRPKNAKHKTQKCAAND